MIVAATRTQPGGNPRPGYCLSGILNQAGSRSEPLMQGGSTETATRQPCIERVEPEWQATNLA
jgi:hypothetical protein